MQSYTLLISDIRDTTQISFLYSNSSFTECVRRHNSLFHQYDNDLIQCTEDTFSDNNKCQHTTQGLSFSTGVRIFKNVDFKICSSDDNGGAIICTGESTHLTVQRCTFSGCHVTNPSSKNGGAIYASYMSSAAIESCSFASCSAYCGGGLYIGHIYSTPSFSECQFSSCKGGYLGGGAFVGSCNQTTSFIACSECVFTKGADVYATSALRGGGIYLDIYSNDHANTIRNTLFTKNAVNNAGGGLRIYESELGFSYSVYFCFFSGNTASSVGQDVHLVSVNFNSFLFCYTTSTAQDRLYVHPPLQGTNSASETHTPNWLPLGMANSLTVSSR